MNITGMNWLVTCTPRYGETVAFFRNVLGLAVKDEGIPATDTRFARYVQFELPDHSVVEVLDAGPTPPEGFSAPVVQFRVDDISATRAAMEGAGVEFLGPTFRSEGEGWAYFRAPDGHVYLIGGPCGAAGRTRP
jgi:catechol 2,3-dioxygenase-like lactoylglutathione lyase family enzyme